MQDNSDVSYLSWGIFQVAYDSASPRRPFPHLTDLRAYYKPSRMFLKFLEDLWYMDRWHSSLFYVSTLWVIVAPAFSLYFAHVVISSVSFHFLMAYFLVTCSLPVRSRIWENPNQMMKSRTCGLLFLFGFFAG